MDSVHDSAPQLVNAAELAELGIFEEVYDDPSTRPWIQPPSRTPRTSGLDPLLKGPSVTWADVPTPEDRAWFSGYCAGREGLDVWGPLDASEPEMAAFLNGNAAGLEDRAAALARESSG